MVKVSGKLMKTAALAAAVMLSVTALPVTQFGSIQAPQIIAEAYEDSDEEYTMVTSGNVTYAKFSDHMEAYSCSDGTTSIVIPSSVDGLPVTAVMRYAFQFTSLKSVTLPDSIKTIGYYSFGFNSDLTSIELPSSLEVMEMHAFEYCSNLSTVKFPNKLVKIHDKCFDNTPWLDSKMASETLVTVNGALINASKASGDITLSSDIKYVSPGAFSRNNNITSVVFPATVDELCDSTFYMCENLRSVELPAIKSIDNLALGACPSLRELKLSGKLTKIEEYAFMDTTNSATITFYGSQSKWQSVQKPDCDFLQRANMVYDESYVISDPQPSYKTYPTNIKVEYNTKYHQVRFTWDKVQGADRYGIAVYLAGKWRIQTQSITTNTYTTPKNLTPGKTYKVAIAARVNGQWDSAGAIKHAVNITVK